MNFYILIPREEFESTVRKIKIFLPAALEFFSCLYIYFGLHIFLLLTPFLITIIILNIFRKDTHIYIFYFRLSIIILNSDIIAVNTHYSFQKRKL